MEMEFQILQQGDTGENVKILQEKLKILGFYLPMITGSFGLATKQGVEAFQERYNLNVTGVVDQETWDKLFEYTEPAIEPISLYPTLSYGSEGSAVKDLQTKLKALLYYTGPINSIFDLETEIALKRFQLLNDLTTTGTTNNQTWNLINTLYGNLNDCVTGETESGGINTFTYTVQNGDTLYSIARKYNTTVTALKELNNLSSDTIRVGQVLKIPNEDFDEEISYVVQKGDTLYSIARKYNTTVDAIKEKNRLTSDILSIGQVLTIPSNSENYVTYTVVSGDTLYSIARRFDTTVDTIKEYNNLKNNTLQIGTVLKIPKSGSENYVTYTVKEGDTLYSIARNFNTTVSEIKRLNGLTSDILTIGEVLKIGL